MLRLVAALALVLGVALGPVADAQDARYGQQKVVYHINYEGGDGGKAYRGAMANIQNHINAVGARNLDVKVVLHGNGVGLLLDAKGNDGLRARIASLKGQNVGFQVCNNTLTGNDLTTGDLYDVRDGDVVPSGVAELSHLQQQGYTYIKP